MKKPKAKKSARQWIRHVNKHPETHGRTKKDIKQVDKLMEKTEGN